MEARVAVVIPGGGGGGGLGARIPKPFVPIQRVPILTMTVSHFARHPAVAAIVVAAPESHVGRTRHALSVMARRSPLSVVPGGRPRQHSVWLRMTGLHDRPHHATDHERHRPQTTPT